MTTVSIVLPIVNARRWLDATLDSIRAQTYPLDRIETIIVDSGAGDAGVQAARDYLRRHAMRGSVLAADRLYGPSAARNKGWQAAAGEWVQFIDGDDVLAPDKIEVQTALFPRLPDVIFSSWQRLANRGDDWQPTGSVVTPDLIDPMFLGLVSPRAGLLGPALIRKKSLEAVGGFSDGVPHLDGEHLLLKLAAISGKFIEAPSASPLFFVRQVPGVTTPPNVDLARQHLQNVVIAEAMLRQHRGGMLTPADKKEIARLCDASLSQLYEHDWAAFQQHWQWLRDINPSYVPQHSLKLKLASRVIGYESAEGLALASRWVKAGPTRAFRWVADRARIPAWDARPAWSSMPDRVRDGMRPVLEVRDTLMARAGGGYRLAGAAAAIAVGAITLWAGIVAMGELGSSPTPASVTINPRVAEAPRAAPGLAQMPSVAPRDRTAERASPAEPFEPRTAAVPTAEPPRATTPSAPSPEPARSEPAAAPAQAAAPAERARASSGTSTAVATLSVAPGETLRRNEPVASAAPVAEVAPPSVTPSEAATAGASAAPAVAPLHVPIAETARALEAVPVAPAAIVTASVPLAEPAQPTAAATPAVGPAPAPAEPAAPVAAPAAPLDVATAPAAPAVEPQASAAPAAAVVAAPATPIQSSEPPAPPVAPAEVATAVVTPPPASAGAAPAIVAALAARPEPARTREPVAAPTSPREAATAAVTPPEPAQPSPGAAPAVVPAPVAETARSAEQAAPPVRVAEARTAAVEPAQPVASTPAARAPLPAAATEPSRGSETAAPAVAPVEKKTAAVTPADTPRPGASVSADAALPTPASNAAPSAAPAPQAPVLTAEDRARAERMIARGERDLEDGNIALARQFFQRAAAAGDGRGALLLASTYDARELARLRAVGVQANVALARKWYERARELGASEAQERLARLPPG